MDHFTAATVSFSHVYLNHVSLNHVDWQHVFRVDLDWLSRNCIDDLCTTVRLLNASANSSSVQRISTRNRSVVLQRHWIRVVGRDTRVNRSWSTKEVADVADDQRRHTIQSWWVTRSRSVISYVKQWEVNQSRILCRAVIVRLASVVRVRAEPAVADILSRCLLYTSPSPRDS